LIDLPCTDYGQFNISLYITYKTTFFQNIILKAIHVRLLTKARKIGIQRINSSVWI